MNRTEELHEIPAVKLICQVKLSARHSKAKTHRNQILIARFYICPLISFQIIPCGCE